MESENKNIRSAIYKAGLKHWQVARALGVSQSTFCLWLRSEVTEEKNKQIMQAIKELEKEQ